MQANQAPTKLPAVWANSAGSGYKNTIPTTSQIGVPGAAGRASFADGFPPLNWVARAAGGVPPFGGDFNGFLAQLSAGLQWLQAGGVAAYDATFQTVIGGYPSGAVVASLAIPGAYWASTVDNNLSNPDIGGAGWVLAQRIVPPSTSVESFYVAQNGSDGSGNFGLSSGAPLATIQAAIGIVLGSYDLRNSGANIHLIAGGTNTFAAFNMFGRGVSGSGVLTVIADSSVSLTGANLSLGAQLTMSGPVTVTGGVTVVDNAYLLVGNGPIFNSISGPQLYCRNSSTIELSGSFTTSGSPQCFIEAQIGATVLGLAGTTVTLSGTPFYSGAFIIGASNATIDVSNVTWSGGATGTRFQLSRGSGIYTGTNGSTTFLPGNVAGTLDNVSYTGTNPLGPLGSWYN